MTLSIYAEERYLADVATNSGWGQFIGWAETLPDSPRLHGLAEDGFCDEPVELLAELKKIERPRDREVAEVFDSILAALGDLPDLDGVATVIVSDGFGDIDEEGDGDEVE